MADTVTTQELIKTDHKSLFVFSNRSDGVGEAAVQKIDISALPGAPTKVKITKIVWAVSNNMSVDILFDHTVDDRVITLNGNGALGANELQGGMEDPASAGGTGDILFTTTSAAAGDGYTIFIEIKAVS